METNMFGTLPERYYLKHRDTTVLSFDRNCDNIQYDNLSYAPYPLQQRELSDTQYGKKLYNWLSSRATSLTRRNANLLYMIAGKARIPQSGYELVLEYGGVSLHDMWWITKHEHQMYSEINMFDNPWSEDLSDVALTGVLQNVSHISSPELTAQGNWAKRYIRFDDGIYLYKADSISSESSTDIPESSREWFISEMLNYAGVDCAKYTPVEYKGIICSATLLLTDAYTAWIPLADLKHLDNVSDQLESMTKGQVSLMYIIDFLVGNIDRHDRNWSVVTDIYNRIIELAPLYDFNFSFENYIPKHQIIPQAIPLKYMKSINKIEAFVYEEVWSKSLPKLVLREHAIEMGQFVKFRLHSLKELLNK